MKKQLMLVHLVLMIGIAGAAIPMASGVEVEKTAIVHQDLVQAKEQLPQETVGRDSAVRGPVAAQDDRYERRRRYWEDRLERELDEEEGPDDGADEDKADSKESKDDKAKKDDKGDSDEEVEREIEQRREYWSRRLDRDW